MDHQGEKPDAGAPRRIVDAAAKRIRELRRRLAERGTTAPGGSPGGNRTVSKPARGRCKS